VAVRVQRPTETMASVPKVAAPSLAVATVVPLRTHEEEMVMESLKFVCTGIDPSSTKTTKAVMDFPAMAVLCAGLQKRVWWPEPPTRGSGYEYEPSSAGLSRPLGLSRPKALCEPTGGSVHDV